MPRHFGFAKIVYMDVHCKSRPGSLREFILPVTVIGLTFGLPLTGIVDCYPFTGAPMFNEEPKVYCEYKAHDGQGNEIPLELLRLQRNDNGNPPGHGHGRKPKKSIDRLGKIPSEEEIEMAVWGGLFDNRIAQKVHGSITVEIQVIGDLDGNRIGVIPEKSRTQTVWIQ